MKLLEGAYDAENFRAQGHELIDMLADQLQQNLERGKEKVITWMEPDAALQKWQNDWDRRTEKGTLDFFREVLQDSIALSHPRYMGHQINPPVPVAALAGLLSDFLNNGMGVYEMGVVSTALERLVIQLFLPYFGWENSGGGFLTSGGTLANLTALLAARSHKAGNDVWKDGMDGQLALMVSEEAHYCVDRAARIMGWGAKGVIKIPSDERHRMRTELLEQYYRQAEAAGIRVIAVVGSACTTSTGTYDDLEAIGAFAHKKGLWFHVDGAHGASAVLSEKYRSLAAGITLADSIAMDFHKTLLSPALTTGLFFRNGSLRFRTFSQQADYLFEREEEDWYNMAKQTLECTKLMMSLKVYSTVRTLGFETLESYIDRVFDQTAHLATIIEGRPGWELKQQPDCNIVCFRMTGSADLNALNEYIRKQSVLEGKFYVVKTVLRGQFWLRCTLTNPFTEKQDILGLLDNLEVHARHFTKG